MNKELLVIEKKPTIPVNWDYNKSVSRVKQIIYKWKNITLELAQELFIAREVLDARGSNLPNVTNVTNGKTWTNYCKEIGVERMTVHRWLERYFVTNVTKLKTPELPKGKYQVIYADPPWQFDNAGFEQSAASHYPTMSTEEIMKLKVPSDNDSILFLWATNAMLEDALEVMKGWGFVYKSNIVWVKKRGVGIGWFVDSRHEMLLIGVKGSGLHPLWKSCSWIEADSNKHSKKPEIFYEIIEKMYPKQRYIELFARNKRDRWISFGNEL